MRFVLIFLWNQKGLWIWNTRDTNRIKLFIDHPTFEVTYATFLFVALALGIVALSNTRAANLLKIHYNVVAEYLILGLEVEVVRVAVLVLSEWKD